MDFASISATDKATLAIGPAAGSDSCALFFTTLSEIVIITALTISICDLLHRKFAFYFARRHHDTLHVQSGPAVSNGAFSYSRKVMGPVFMLYRFLL